MSPPEGSGGKGAVVYLGPSLPLKDARAVLPHADFRHPIALGDLVSLVDSGMVADLWAVGIVDGVFYQSLPVWHKEILYAIERGITVLGASSMGALRAAECDVFGMVGIGSVYRDFACGTLTDDDEVALLHGDAETGWAGYSLPMVNIRATLARAIESGRIGRRTGAVVLEAAKGLWFPERTLVGILDAADQLAPGEADLEAASEVLTDEYVDVKRSDAIALLEEIAKRSAMDPPCLQQERAVSLVRSSMFQSLRERDRQIERDGAVLCAEEISRYVALSHPEFAEIRDRALDRLASEELALIWQVDVSEAETEAEMARFRARRMLDSEGAVDDWCSSNDMNRTELDELIATEARRRKVRNWLLMVRTKRLMVKPLLDELRLRGEYESWTAKAARLKVSVPAGTDPEDGLPDAARQRDLMRDQVRAGSWRPDVPVELWSLEAGFRDLSDLLAELLRHRKERDGRRALLATLSSLFPDDAGC